MERVFVERRFSEPVNLEELRASAASASGCFERHRVKGIRSVVSRDGCRMICEYEAPDAESVRRAQLQAKLPFEAVWTAEVFEAEPQLGS